MGFGRHEGMQLGELIDGSLVPDPPGAWALAVGRQWSQRGPSLAS
jgi:hypothetical protein